MCHIVGRGKRRKWRLATKNLNAREVESLYVKHGPALTAYVCCCGLDFASAEDVVQQVFLKLLQGQNSMPQTPPAYLFRAVRNASLNLRRNRQHEVGMQENETWFVGPSAHPEEVLTLQAALRTLPEEQRETVFLKVWGGLTLQEIADTLEIPVNTAASRYRYALGRLWEQLRPAQEG